MKLKFKNCIMIFIFIIFGISLGYAELHPGTSVISFDGIDEYVEIPDDDIFSVADKSEMTISFWLRPDSNVFEKKIGAGYVNLLGKGYFGFHEWNFRMYSEDNTKGFDNRFSFSLYETGGKGVSTYFQEEMLVNEWINILVKISDGKIYLYKNGVLKDSNVYEGKVNLQNSIAPLRIGTRSVQSFFDGSIGDVAFFNKALDEKEIEEIYNRGIRFRLTENKGNYKSSDSLTAYYKLNDDDSLITDYSDSNKNGNFYSGEEITIPTLTSIKASFSDIVEDKEEESETDDSSDTVVELPVDTPEDNVSDSVNKTIIVKEVIEASNGISFDGVDDFIEIPDSDDLSVTETGEFTVSAWIRPDALKFDKDLSSGYIHWLGKGEPGEHEWAFRMYSEDNTAGRENRISFYLWNNDGGLGAGSYVQESVEVGEWIHLVARVDKEKVYLYKNGVLKDSDYYYESPYWIIPENADAPLRIGTRQEESFLEGGIAEVAIFDKALDEKEIKEIYNGQRAFDFANNSENYNSADNVVAWYRLNETDETKGIKDYSGNGHDGIVNLGTEGQLHLSDDYNSSESDSSSSETTPVEDTIGNLEGLPSEGLVGFWNFDELTTDGVIDDLSKNDNKGELINGALVENGYATFDGIDDKITIPDHDDLSPATTGAMTVSAWIKVDDFSDMTCGSGSGCYVNFMGKGSEFGSDGNIEWQSRVYSDGNDWKSRIFFFYVFNPEGGLGVGSRTERPSEIGEGEWFHFVGIYTGTENMVYKNGVHTDTDPTIDHPDYGTMTLVNGDGDFNIGWNDGSGGWFKGEIDEVMIYDRVLSESEINDIYDAQKEKVTSQI